MQKVKLFMGAATGDGIQDLEDEINKWAEKAKVEIKNMSISVRLIPVGERASLTAEIVDQLLVCLTYETR